MFDGIFSFNQSRYKYELSKDKKLSDYGMEAQANLLADYFLLLRFGNRGSAHLFEQKYRYHEQSALLPLYKSVLSDFISNPRDKSNLPGSKNRRQDDRIEH